MIIHRQKGFTLVVTFLIVTLMLAIVLSMASLVANRIKAIGIAEKNTAAFYAARSGVEQALYYSRKDIPAGAKSGLCNICNNCATIGCTGCILSNASFRSPMDCNVNSCKNCRIRYTYAFNGRTFAVDTSVTTILPIGGPPLPITSIAISATGTYQGMSKTAAQSYTTQ